MRAGFTRAVVAFAAVALVVPVAVVIGAQGASAAPVLLSAGKSATASSSNQTYVAGNVTDGNPGTYWESQNNAFPQWVQVDLGSSANVTNVSLKLPAGWGARDETVLLQGSADGSTFTTLKASASYTFSGANTVAVDVTDTTTRYVRATVTANTSWPAAQLSEVEVYGDAPTTPTDPPPVGTNLAQGRPVSATSVQQGYVAGNAVDGSTSTYWEGASGAYPSNLTVTLAAQAALTGVVVKLNPDPAWGARRQTFAIQGRSGTGAFVDLVPSAEYAFSPSSGNAVTVPVTGSATDVRVVFTANTGAGNAQVAELQVFGSTTPTPTAPDLQITLTPAPPIAVTPTTPITLGAIVRNAGTAAAPATTVSFTLGGQTVGTANLAALAVGAQATVTVNAGTRATGTYPVVATVDPANTVAESNETNNVANGSVVVSTGPEPTTADLQVSLNGSSPAAPTPTDVITLGATVRNSGTAAAAATTVVLTLGGQSVGTASIGALAAGAQTTVSVGIGTRAAGTYAVGATVDPSNVVAESNESNNTASGSLTVTAPPTGGGTNLSVGRPATASSTEGSFVAANAVDTDANSYWEGAGGQYPSTLGVNLASQSTLQQVSVAVPPIAAWGPRTQTFSLEAKVGNGPWTPIKASAQYAFSTATGNKVTIPVTGSATDVRVVFTANTGAGNGQVSTFEVTGVPAPNPDLTITGVTASPAAPVETAGITLSATVTNTGNLASAATTADLTVDGTKVGSATVPALAAGASATVSAAIGTRPAGSYTIGGVVDPANTVTEQNEANNAYSNPTRLVVSEAPGPDLQVLSIASNPANPAAGSSVSFTVVVKNRGNTGAAASVTRLVAGSTTLNGSTGAIAAGATANVAISGTWTAVAGGATLLATADATNLVVETNENNNTYSQAVVVGRGAAVPYTEYEAEAGTYTGQLLTTDPLRTFGHTNFATESSGRQSVRLASQGQYVQLTSTNATNSIVVRNSVPDSADGTGQDATISLYANGTFVQKLTFSSRYSWLYGTTDEPEGLTNRPGGDARRLFDESHALLPQSYPAGTVFKLQRDAGDTAAFYVIDLVDLEQVAPPLSKPADCTSITAYGAVPNDGIDDSTAIQAAVTADQNGQISCVWIPEGQWRQEKKILTVDPLHRGTYNQVGISNTTIRGAGMWYSQLYSLIEPQNANTINHPHEGNFGFDIDKNVQISDIAIFGSGRIRGGDGNGEGGVGLNGRFGTGTSISNVWIEHANVAVWVGRDYDNIPDLWGPADGLQFSGMRIRDTYADGINFSNGTRNSRVFNSSFRTTGDDSLAMWNNPYVKDRTVDAEHDNHFVNNTIQLPWRANGIAIYGGTNNSIENNLVYDTMNYPGIMLATDHSPLPFGGTTLIANNALYRTGGAFWNEAQEFGAITLFPSTLDITGVTIRDTDIYDSTYDGIQFKNGGGNMPNVAVSNVRIDGSKNGGGILAMSGARGNAVLSNVQITNSADGNVLVQPGSQFVITGS